MTFLRVLPLFLAAFFLVAGVSSGPSQVVAAEKSKIMVKDAWARARPESAKVGGAFIMIMNNGTEPDRLMSVMSPVAKRTEIHETKMKDGVMSMSPVEEIVIAPGKMVMLEPGGLHVMLMGLTGGLAEGEEFPMTLVFEHAGKIDVMVQVKDAGAKSSGHTH
jgi:periplasmic copper chaperone A